MTLAPLPSVGLLEACDDRRLLGFGLWPKQRELLEAVEAGPRLHVWALGRRSAKTTTAAIVGVWDCLLRPELGELVRPRERRHSVAVATSLRQARLFVRAALSIVEGSPLLARFVQSSSDDEILFANGTALSAFPCTARGVRGWPLSSLLLDEAAHFVSETEGPAVADRVFNALAPSTAQFGDAARIIVASTPWGRDGLFAELYARASSGELDDAVAQQASSAESNPTLDPVFLVREQARDPEGFRSEYLAEFVGGGAAFLDPGRIEAAVADRDELPPEAASQWVAGLDPAFSSDPFGLAIVGRSRQAPERLLLGVARRWRPPPVARERSLEESRAIEDQVLDEVADVCLRYGARAVTDQYRAAGVVEYLRRRGVPVELRSMTASSKTEAFTALRARLYLEALELYAEPVLLGELRRLRSRFAAGRSSVVVPRVGGSHGDVAQALALAVFEHDRHGMALDGLGRPGWAGRGRHARRRRGGGVAASRGSVGELWEPPLPPGTAT